MSTQITTAHVQQYGANVFHLSQQKGSRLRNAVRNESVKGKSRFFDRIGSAVAQKKTSRHSDTPQIDTPHSRRMVSLETYEYADLVDDADKLRTLMEPTNEYVMAAMWALGRSMDDELIDAHGGNAYGGESGGTTVALGNGQKLASVASAAGAKLNVQALRRAKKILDANDVDESIKRYISPSSVQMENLLSETEISSSDFNTVRALVDGRLSHFMGFDFIRQERNNEQSGTLAFDTTSGAVGSGGGDADTYEQVPCWAEDGLLLAIGTDIKARVSERADKSYSDQVYACMDIGATRMEEEKCVQILCVAA